MPAATSPRPIVIAAFEPFDGRRHNRSWQVVERLPARAGLEKVQLPVDLPPLERALRELLSRRPRGLLLLGESSARAVAVEQIAVNAFDPLRTPPHRRTDPVAPIEPGGPVARRAGWDARALAVAINRAGVRAVASFHAGTYACNAALYLALGPASAPPVGFVHVPRFRWPRGPSLGQLVRVAEMALLALDPDQRA